MLSSGDAIAVYTLVKPCLPIKSIFKNILFQLSQKNYQGFFFVNFINERLWFSL